MEELGRQKCKSVERGDELTNLYAITVKEISQKTVVTRAKSLENALEKVDAAYSNGKISIDDDISEININACERYKDGIISEEEAKEKYYEFVDNTNLYVDYIIECLDKLKREHPDQEIVLETPKGTVSLKIGDANIYEGIRGELVMDSE